MQPAVKLSNFNYENSIHLHICRLQFDDMGNVMMLDFHHGMAASVYDILAAELMPRLWLLAVC